MITPLPGATPLVPGSCTLPLPGHHGRDRRRDRQRRAQRRRAASWSIKKPWPSMIRTIWGDPERFKKSYYPEELGASYYLAGDGAIRDAKTGYFTHHRPHRRRAQRLAATAWARWRSSRRWCRNTDLVAEAAVVGRPDDTTGEAICAFVVLKRARPTGEEAKKIANELRNWVAKEIGPIAKPKDIRFGDNLPKTRSGKIMRRLLRSHRQGRGDHAGHLDAGEPGDPGAVGGEVVGRGHRGSMSAG